MSGPGAVLVIGGDDTIDDVLVRLGYVTTWDDGRAALWVMAGAAQPWPWDQLSLLDAMCWPVGPAPEGAWDA